MKPELIKLQVEKIIYGLRNYEERDVITERAIKVKLDLVKFIRDYETEKSVSDQQIKNIAALNDLLTAKEDRIIGYQQYGVARSNKSPIKIFWFLLGIIASRLIQILFL